MGPFLLEELMRALGDDARLPDGDVAARVRALGPRSIGHAVLGRLAGMRPEALALARAVAVLEVDADLGAAADTRRDRHRGGPDRRRRIGRRPGLRARAPLCALLIPSSPGRSAPDLPMDGARMRTRSAARALEHHAADPDRVVAHLMASDPSGRRICGPGSSAPRPSGRSHAAPRMPRPVCSSALSPSHRTPSGAGRSCSNSVTPSAARAVSARPRTTCARR